MTAIDWARFELRRVLGRYPALFLPIVRLRPDHRGAVVQRDTEVVIEGFPRSGNTFAVAAFRIAQNRPMALASHVHAPAQVRYAVEHGIPTLIVIRHPLDAVTSLLIRHPDVTPRQAMRGYVDFHRRIAPLRSGYVTATFDETTTAFGPAIDRLNEKFGTNFARFEHTDDEVEAAFALVEQMHGEDVGRRSGRAEDAVARPSDERSDRKRAVAASLETTETEPYVSRAIAEYEAALQGR